MKIPVNPDGSLNCEAWLLVLHKGRTFSQYMIVGGNDAAILAYCNTRR